MKKIIFMVACLMCLASCAKKEAVDNAPADAAVKADVAKDGEAKKDTKSDEADKKASPDKVEEVPKPVDVAPKADAPANPVA